MKSALEAARRLTNGSGRPRRRTAGRRGRGSVAAPRDRENDEVARHRGGWSGPAPDPHDPARIGEVLDGWVGDRGWERPLASARVFSAWAEIVGTEVAAHCAPTDLRDGELRVTAESTAWATQLRLLSATLLARVAADVGPDLVRRIVVTGPAGPSWKHGRWSVRGARGPRDTYG